MERDYTKLNQIQVEMDGLYEQMRRAGDNDDYAVYEAAKSSWQSKQIEFVAKYNVGDDGRKAEIKDGMVWFS